MFAGHEEQRLHLKTLEYRTKAVRAVVLLHIDDLLGGSDGFDGHVVVAAVFENDQAPVNAIENEIESQVAVGHRDDGVDRVRITATHQVTELLIDDVNLFAVVEFWGELGEFLGNQLADSAQFLVTERIGGVLLENHFSAFEHGTLGDENRGIAAGIAIAIVDQEFGEILNIEFVFGNDAAIRGARHRRQHGSESRIAPEDFQNHEALVGTGR